jgi:uncharacterized protein YdaU (DUF1376 family)
MPDYNMMPVWTDAYLADTGHLTTTEHGAYLLLLMAAWRSPNCDLPDDDKTLSKYCRMTPSQWRRSGETLKAFFYVLDGRLRQKKLDAVRQKTQDLSDSRSKSGHTGGVASGLVRKKTAEARASFETKQNEATVTKKITEIDTDVSISPPNGFADWWEIYPRKVGKGAAKKQYKTALKKADTDDIQNATIAFAKTVEGKDPNFIPHPATWLSQERWTDDQSAINPTVPAVSSGNAQGSRPSDENIVASVHRFVASRGS